MAVNAAVMARVSMMMTVQFIVKAKLPFFQKPRKGKGTPKPTQPGCIFLFYRQ